MGGYFGINVAYDLRTTLILNSLHVSIFAFDGKPDKFFKRIRKWPYQSGIAAPIIDPRHGQGVTILSQVPVITLTRDSNVCIGWTICICSEHQRIYFPSPSWLGRRAEESRSADLNVYRIKMMFLILQVRSV